MAARTAGLVLAIAPLGLLLGCPLPLGMAALGGAEGTEPERGLVAWCWGINGMFGVAGSAGLWPTRPSSQSVYRPLAVRAESTHRSTHRHASSVSILA
jgi:hypothetical protein